MQKIIEKLYNGEIYPAEQLNVRVYGYEEARKNAGQAHDEFESQLCQPMKEELDEMMMKHMHESSLEDTQAFVDGFKLGARMMAEILWEDKE